MEWNDEQRERYRCVAYIAETLEGIVCLRSDEARPSRFYSAKNWTDRRSRQIDKYRNLIHWLLLWQKHAGKYSLKVSSPLKTEDRIEFHGSKLKHSIAHSMQTPAKMIVSSLIVHRSTKMSLIFSPVSSFFLFLPRLGFFLLFSCLIYLYCTRNLTDLLFKVEKFIFHVSVTWNRLKLFQIVSSESLMGERNTLITCVWVLVDFVRFFPE